MVCIIVGALEKHLIISSLRLPSLTVSSIPAMVVVTSPSDLFSSSNLKLHPADVARDEIWINHIGHSSLFVPSYLGTAANMASYFCCWVVAARDFKSICCCCWTVTIVWWFYCWVLAILSWPWANCSMVLLISVMCDSRDVPDAIEGAPFGMCDL